MRGREGGCPSWRPGRSNLNQRHSGQSHHKRLHAHVDHLRLQTDARRRPGHNNDPSLKESAYLEDTGRPTKTHRSATGMSPGCFSACSTLVSVDLIQLCRCEAVSRTWIKLLLSLDWYQHRGVLVLH